MLTWPFATRSRRTLNHIPAKSLFLDLPTHIAWFDHLKPLLVHLKPLLGSRVSTNLLTRSLLPHKYAPHGMHPTLPDTASLQSVYSGHCHPRLCLESSLLLDTQARSSNQVLVTRWKRSWPRFGKTKRLDKETANRDEADDVCWWEVGRLHIQNSDWGLRRVHRHEQRAWSPRAEGIPGIIKIFALFYEYFTQVH